MVFVDLITVFQWSSEDSNASYDTCGNLNSNVVHFWVLSCNLNILEYFCSGSLLMSLFLIVFLNLTIMHILVGCKWTSSKRGLEYGNKDTPWGSSCRFIVLIALLNRIYLIRLYRLKVRGAVINWVYLLLSVHNKFMGNCAVLFYPANKFFHALKVREMAWQNHFLIQLVILVK